MFRSIAPTFNLPAPACCAKYGDVVEVSKDPIPAARLWHRYRYRMTGGCLYLPMFGCAVALRPSIFWAIFQNGGRVLRLSCSGYFRMLRCRGFVLRGKRQARYTKPCLFRFAAAEFKKGGAAGGRGRRGMHFRPFVRHPTSRHLTNQQGRQAGGGPGQTRPTIQTPRRSRREMSQQRCSGLRPALPLPLILGFGMASNATGHRSESRIGHELDSGGGRFETPPWGWLGE